MHMHKVTPKDFFLWAGAMIALYVSVGSFLTLFFNYIDAAFPDKVLMYMDPYSGAVRFAIASLIVLFPLYVLLMTLIRRDIARDEEKRSLWVRRWALVMTVFVAGAALAIDLITLINTYLNGEITERFALKVVIVFLVAGGGFLHFLAEMWGYWDENPKRLRSVALIVSVLIVATIAAGLAIFGSPQTVREYRFDDQKVSDLQLVQSQVVNYWQSHRELPRDLSVLNDALGGFTVPVDPESGESYAYATTSALSFKLCAHFNLESSPNSASLASLAVNVPVTAPYDITESSWYHEAGDQCFFRTIDPARYPALNNSEK